MTKDYEGVVFQTPKARLLFPSLIEARGYVNKGAKTNEAQNPKFQASFFVTKGTPEFNAIAKQISDYCRDNKLDARNPLFYMPFTSTAKYYDPETEDTEVFKDGFMLKSSTREEFPPTLVKRMPNGSTKTIPPQELKAGDYIVGMVSIRAFKANERSFGITCYLSAICKLADGEHLGTKAKAKFDFGDIEPMEDANAYANVF